MFVLGSHNTMSYLKPKLWFLKPFAWMAQCQNKDIKYQYGLGIRYFDIRVRFDEFGNPEFAHGLISYKGDVISTLKELNSFGEEIKIRLILELSKETFDTPRQVALFRFNCCRWVKRFKNLKFHCGIKKYDWEVVYKFKNPEPEIDQKVSSMVGSKLDDIFPFIYALTHNEKNIDAGTDKEYLLLDYIQIG